MIVKWLKKALLALTTGVIPVFIAACYGAPMGTGESCNDVDGTVKDRNGAPIPNILVRCLQQGSELDSTYSLPGDGSFALTTCAGPCDTLTFSDVDDAGSGGAFADKEVPYDGSGTVDVVLDAAE